MYLKKRLIMTAVVLVFAAAVLYGSMYRPSGAVSEGEVNAPENDQKETIYFWYSDESLGNYVNSAAVSFSEKENVRVIPILKGESEYLEAINQASLHSEQVPDAYIISHDSLEKAYMAGLATQIQDEGNICSADNFPPAALSAVTYHGKLVAYPLSFETSVLVYNDTYLAQWARQMAEKELEEAGIPLDETVISAKAEGYFGNAIPASVDDILNVANNYEAPEGVEGVLKWDVSDIFYNFWIVGNYMIVGGDAGDDEGRIDIENEETVQCLEVYKALNQFFYIETHGVTYDSALQDFIDGRIVFTIATTDAIKRLSEAKEQGILTFDYGLAAMPDVSGELVSRSMSVTSTVAVNSYSEHKELANRFAAYLVDSCADALYERTNKIPAKTQTNQDNGAVQIFKQEYAESISLPKMMKTENFWLQLEALFSKVWEGADVRDHLKELAGRISKQMEP